ncbi:MAG: hypothetical protein ACI81P_000764 [Neolewinella sp.]|jgi:hypothetical protein
MDRELKDTQGDDDVEDKAKDQFEGFDGRGFCCRNLGNRVPVHPSEKVFVEPDEGKEEGCQGGAYDDQKIGCQDR